jgi:hypothetical protein
MAIFADKIDPGRTQERRTPDDIRKWMQGKVSAFSNINVNSIIRANPDQITSTIRPGYMYLYGYYPKYWETLKFYDRFPLVFPYRSVEGGFMGLNMHYLPPIYRAKLMDALYDTANNKNYDETTRIRINYNLLSSAAKYRYFEPCVHRYLKEKMVTRALQIPANEWDYALFMPLERFQTKGKRINKQIVFTDSRKRFQ